MFQIAAPPPARAAHLLLGLLLTAAAAAPARAERPPTAKLLPDATVLLLWIPDAPEMSQRFMSTSLGRIGRDPHFRPLIQQLYGSLDEAVAGAKDRVGLSLPELLKIPQGEIALAVVATEEAPPALVVLLDAKDQLPNARRLLERGAEAWVRSGAERSEETVAGTTLLIFDRVGPRRRKLIFFEKDATLVAGSDLEVLKQILNAWNGEGRAALGDQQKFAAVMGRCRAAKEGKPHVVWYVDPIALVRSIGQDNPGARLAVAMLPALGLDGVRAFGGTLTFDVGQLDSVLHWHLLLESPRTGVPAMIALESGDTEPERWVPADVATYTTLHWDFQKSYQALTDLYDGFRGQGALARDLERRFEGPLGLDFENDLLPALAGRVTHVTRIERPVTGESRATLVAFQLRDPEPVAKVLKRVFEKNAALVTGRSHAGKEYFRWTPPRLADPPPESSPPTPCFGIVEDYLVAADREGLYQQVIVTSAGGGKRLADAPDFKLIADRIGRLSAGSKPAMIGFERPEEGMRLLYQRAVSDDGRRGLRAENNPFFRFLKTALEKTPLPPFAVVEQYLAPSGAMLVEESTGLHYQGFTLKREAD